MTQEEKELLLKDLCARLPYGVISNRPSGNAKITEIRFDEEYNSFVCYSSNGFGGDISFEKPYLRSMSSMTQEEKIKLYQITGFYYFSNNELLKDEWRHFSNALSENKLFLPYPIWEDDLQKTFDWLNANHFDYRGLIEKGLALEAPKDMYK